MQMYSLRTIPTVTWFCDCGAQMKYGIVQQQMFFQIFSETEKELKTGELKHSVWLIPDPSLIWRR